MNKIAQPRNLFLSAVVMLFASLIIVPPGTARAASIYDTTYQRTTTLVQTGYFGCSNQDITYNWSNYLTSDEFSGLKESFALAKSQGKWGVTISWGVVEVFWTEDTSLYLDWMDPTYGGGYSVMAKGNNVHQANFSLSGYYSPKPCVPYVSSYWTSTSTVIADKYGNNKNLFVMTDHPNYPPGYEGASLVTNEPKAKYVAMGDSFSSGEGNPAFEAGTDANGVNECHRSPQAYPRLLQNDTTLNLGTTAFVACSGAKTSNILNGGAAEGAWGEKPQIDALSADTEVATITIGGNDVGFRDFATACTVGSCDFATSAYSDIHGKIINDLPGKLSEIYEAIDDATPSTANIYVVGYPQIAPAEMPTGPNSACYPLNGGTDNPDPELNDGATAYAVVSELNSVIHDAVTNTNSTKFHFVDPNLPGSPFIGHDWCQQDRYFNLITINNINYSFHPNEDGQEAYKTIVEGEID